MKCFYHSTDLDGHCAGAIVKHKYPECEMIGMDYGEEFPWDSITEGEIVFMVDFSLQPHEDMITLFNHCDLVWIDHHETAINGVNAFEIAIAGIRDTKFAACELTWQYLFPNQVMPRSVFLLGRYDVWDHKDMDVLPFQYGIKQRDTNPEDDDRLWHILFDGNKMLPSYTLVMDIVSEGRTIQKYVNKQNEFLCGPLCYEFEFEGLRFIAANACMPGSKLFDSVYDPDKHDAMMVYYNKNGKHWVVTMYSTKGDVNVGDIAKKHGGGGHKGASGFQCKETPFTLFDGNGTTN